MRLFIKLEIQRSQDVRRTLEHASFLCKMVILSTTDKEELAAPVHFTVAIVQIPCDISFSDNMLDDGQQQY